MTHNYWQSLLAKLFCQKWLKIVLHTLWTAPSVHLLTGRQGEDGPEWNVPG